MNNVGSLELSKFGVQGDVRSGRAIRIHSLKHAA